MRGVASVVMAAWYAGAATLLAPALRLSLRRRVRRGKELAERLPERFGYASVPRPPGRVIWLHAASVGETLSILPVLAELHQRDAAAWLLVTTGTVTSARLLAERLPALGLAGCVRHCFVPLDVPSWVARFMAHWRPDVGGFVESEIWPNLLAAARVRGVQLVLINARLSARSFRGWRRLGGFAAAQFASFAAVQAQSETDAARLLALGARAVTVPGNLKFAAAPLPYDAAEQARLAALLAGRTLWLAASTQPGEEAAILAVHDALARSQPVLTIVVPRHPERGAALAAACAGRAVSRRSLDQDPPSGTGLWIGDTLGELGLYYRLALTVFVGGSLVAHGGQNVLEPARLGCAIAVGPHTDNFTDAVALLEQAGGLVRVTDAASLAAWLAALFQDAARGRAMAAAACEVVETRGDLPGLVADALLALLPVPSG